MVAFYKHNIPDWMDGTEMLGDGAYRAYHVICQLIYLTEGPIALNERGIAGRCNQRVEDFRRYLKQLVELGKVTVEGGRVFNDRANKELSKIEANRRNASVGGRASGTARSGAVLAGESDAVPTKERDAVPARNPGAATVPIGSGYDAAGMSLGSGSGADPLSPSNGYGIGQPPHYDNSLKIHDPSGAALHRDRSLKEKSRVDKTTTTSLRSVVARGAAGFDEIERALRESSGLQNDPSPGLLDLSPMLTLIDQGYDLDRDILPIIRAKSARARNVRTWRYFVDAVVDAKGANGAIQPASSTKVSDDLWEARMAMARRSREWPAEWSPMPGQDGCAVPARMIRPGDGENWRIST